MDISKASLSNLYDLGREGGRVRFKESKGVCTLYIRPKPSPNPVNRKVENLIGLTTLKRKNVLYAVETVCARNGMKFTELMEVTGLSEAIPSNA